MESLAGLGIRRGDIAQQLGVSENTLRKHYREQLLQGSVMANANVAKSLYRRAMGSGQGSVTAAIFWLKCRAGWRDVNPYGNDQIPTTRPPGPSQRTRMHRGRRVKGSKTRRSR